MPSKIVIFGTGTLAQVVASYLPPKMVAAHTVDSEYVESSQVENTVPFDLVQDMYPPDGYEMFIAVTQQNRHRFLMRETYERVKEKGYKLANIIHPTAFVGAGIEIGEGCLVSPLAIVEPHAALGNCVFIRSGAYIGHHTRIGDFTYIAPRAAISGHVNIWPNVFIGINATIRDQVYVGWHAIVGAGATVLDNVDDDTIIKAREGNLLPYDARKVNI